ncbi:hypothetical protein D9615_000902 [Tricholomella constricta]|uniref:Coatomer subunit delta n=1 Tax=Tricholomella constricta TaxID=117010 RepID=A0A8H5M8P8_9AGAR|nr:hypothetical protein D9615_000902 [Tricholomella constricta]
MAGPSRTPGPSTRTRYDPCGLLTCEQSLLNETPAERASVIQLLLPSVYVPFRYPSAPAPPNHFLLPPFLPSIPTTTPLLSTIPTPHGSYPIYSDSTIYSFVHYSARPTLQDIDTLYLFARVVLDMCRSADEREILKNAFEPLGAFDEGSMRSVLEMENHEEKVQEVIARNKATEAKEELERCAKQLEMQRREQQRRTAGAGGGRSYLGGGVSGYSPVPQRFDAPETAAPVTRLTSSSAARSPAFKGSGMKLGTKKTKQAELLDALGGDALASSVGSLDISAPPTPTTPSQPSPIHKTDGRGSVPKIEAERNKSVFRCSGTVELIGDMNLQISDAALHIALSSPSTDFGGNSLEFKQHPDVAKFTPGQERVVALKDASQAFPVGQSLAVLKWRYAGTEESNVPLFSKPAHTRRIKSTVSNDGTCEVSTEYELENEIHDVVISTPLPPGSYPTVSSHSGDWSLDPGSHSLAWTIASVSASDDTRSGSMMFTVSGDDASAFFLVEVTFIGEGSLAGVRVASVNKISGGDDPAFSVDAIVTTEEYLVV